MRLLIKFIFSIIFLLTLNGIVRAQEKKVFDTTEVKINTRLNQEEDEEKTKEEKQAADSLRKINLVKYAAQLVIDYGKLITLASDFESKYEAEFGLIVFSRANISIEYGQGTLDPKKAYKNADFYTIEGNYFRFGADYIYPLNPENMLSIGGRYCMGNYSDKGNFLIGSLLWPKYEEGFGSDDMEANWVELVFSSETMMIKNTFLGLKLRLRYMLEFDTREDIPVYSVPGYGRTFDKTVPVVNLYVKYRLPFGD